MARRSKAGGGIRGTRIYRAFERVVLSVGMGVVAFFIERRLVKAIRSGGVKRAPRTLAEREGFEQAGPGRPHEGSVSSGYPPSAG
ncbi:MAG TPA: hypothetical protein VHI54_02345 [Actinomycetota bacterium]|nr:hypothetical protein [Actinomycetota bacterium]